MPILEKKWYQGIKKPTLQIDILRFIGLRGKLSKKMAQEITGSDYSDVSNAIKRLFNRRMIKKSLPVLKGRRDRIYYVLTSNGLKAFIQGICSPLKSHSTEDFWRALIWYCEYNPNKVSDTEIEEYCSYYETKFLGHPLVNSFIFQSFFFNKLVRKWLRENITQHETISLPQKILESLALKGKINLTQLSEVVGESTYSVKKIIDRYTIRVDDNDISNKDEPIFKKTYPDLSNALIVSNRGITTDVITYRLSLFGLILTMALILFYYKGTNDSRYDTFIEKPFKISLFYDKVDLHKYFDTIASNYKENLPLIFGKWNILQRELGSLFLYDNFDFLFYHKAFSVNMGRTIWVGGNKEFFDNLQALAAKSSELLKLLLIEGKAVLSDYCNNYLKENESSNKLLALHTKINEIEGIVKCFDQIPSHNERRGSEESLRNKNEYIFKQRVPLSNTFVFMERSFSNELTFFFYFNLNNPAFTSMSSQLRKQADLTVKENKMDDLLLTGREVFSAGTPQQRLIKILQIDKCVGKYFQNWLQIVMDYQQATTEKMLRNLRILNYK
jgi:DNA-binding MarR family transcriptional regulator